MGIDPNDVMGALSQDAAVAGFSISDAIYHQDNARRLREVVCERAAAIGKDGPDQHPKNLQLATDLFRIFRTEGTPLAAALAEMRSTKTQIAIVPAAESQGLGSSELSSLNLTTQAGQLRELGLHFAKVPLRPSLLSYSECPSPQSSVG